MIVEFLEEFSAAHVTGVQGVETVDFLNGTATWQADTSKGPETLLNDSFDPADVINWRFGFPTENGIITRDFFTPEGHEISTMMFQTSDGVWHDFYAEVDTTKLNAAPPLGGMPFRVFMDEDNHIQLIDQGNGTFATRIMIDRLSPPTDGQVYTTDDFLNFVPEFITCYLPGSLVRTPNGLQKVEALKKGDLVTTQDAGDRPVRALTQRRVHAPEGNDRPIRIRAGALGMNRPAQDLFVSRQHRILIRSQIVQRMFGTREVFVAAKDLLALDGVEIVTGSEPVTYIHVLLDRHHVIEVNGCLSESLLRGEMLLRAAGETCQADIPARPTPPSVQCRRLIERHIKNNKPTFPSAEAAEEQAGSRARHIP